VGHQEEQDVSEGDSTLQRGDTFAGPTGGDETGVLVGDHQTCSCEATLSQVSEEVPPEPVVLAPLRAPPACGLGVKGRSVRTLSFSFSRTGSEGSAMEVHASAPHDVEPDALLGPRELTHLRAVNPSL
jgi:hypothetical protein